MKRAHVLQHVPFEGPGSMAPWLAAQGFTISFTRLFEADTLPSLQDVELLIIMGGPMSVHDEDAYPWLIPEKAFVRHAVEAGLPVLGVCLGAQLIADAMGGRVYSGPEKEIGWFPVHGVGPASESAFRFPAEVEVFHWHGETFDLPPDAVRLAGSAGCLNQAFQLGRSVMALQFHLETTPESARDLCRHGADELVPGPYVQTAEMILGASPEHYERINALMGEVLDYLLADRRAIQTTPPCD